MKKEGKACTFIGHRKIEESDGLVKRVEEEIERLIEEEGVELFLFGSKSEFDALCLKTVTRLKGKYPHIKRIYVRAEFPYINESYERYLLERYDSTFFPEKILKAGRYAYVERNALMIDESDFCVFYYKKNENYTKKSGTKIAYEYALKRDTTVINLF